MPLSRLHEKCQHVQECALAGPIQARDDVQLTSAQRKFVHH